MVVVRDGSVEAPKAPLVKRTLEQFKSELLKRKACPYSAMYYDRYLGVASTLAGNNSEERRLGIAYLYDETYLVGNDW